MISSHKQCSLCGGKLHVKGDRARRLTVYTESLSTVIGTHYHKICPNFQVLLGNFMDTVQKVASQSPFMIPIGKLTTTLFRAARLLLNCKC